MGQRIAGVVNVLKLFPAGDGEGIVRGAQATLEESLATADDVLVAGDTGQEGVCIGNSVTGGRWISTTERPDTAVPTGVGEAVRVLHLGRSQAGDVPTPVAHTARLSGSARIEERGADRAKKATPGQTADVVAAARHAARGIGARDLARVNPDQTADRVAALHAARGIGALDRAQVIPDQPADTVLARHATRGIGARDRATVTSDQTADLVAVRHADAGIGARDRAIVTSGQTADKALPRYAAAGIGVLDRAVVHADQPADRVRARHADAGMGVLDRGAVVNPDQPADRFLARHATRGIGARDRAPVIPDQTADIAAARHAARGIGALDRAQVIPDQTADVVAAARHAAAHETEIADRAAQPENTEQTDIVRIAPVDGQP